MDLVVFLHDGKGSRSTTTLTRTKRLLKMNDDLGCLKVLFIVTGVICYCI